MIFVKVPIIINGTKHHLIIVRLSFIHLFLGIIVVVTKDSVVIFIISVKLSWSVVIFIISVKLSWSVVVFIISVEISYREKKINELLLCKLRKNNPDYLQMKG